ncbi:derlin-1 [Penicillium herquei]|nr:derlin-1 [Penicillium herquei]
MDQVQAAFWAAPPVSRTITALTLVQSVLVHGGVLSGYYVLFLPSHVFRLLPQIWRLATPFLLTGPKLSFFFDLYFMFHYGSQLENSARFSQPGDFFIYLVFVAFSIMLTAGCFLGGMVFTSALILAFIYTIAQDNRGKKTMLWFIEIPMEYLPWAMLVITLVMSGWHGALMEATGIVAAHLYDFLTRIYPTFGGGRNYLTAPAALQRFFTKHNPRLGNRGYGTAFRPQASQSSQPSQNSQSTRGWTSSIQNPWGSRGAGRRLGGD